MPGSSAKANVLVAAAKTHRARIDGPARSAYLKSAGTIETSSDRVRALTALLADPGDPRK